MLELILLRHQLFKSHNLISIASFIVTIAFSGCGFSGFNRVESIKPAQSIHSVAVDFQSGGVGEYVEETLVKNGFQVYRKEETYRLIRNLGLMAIDPSRPEQLALLRKENIDAFLTCRTIFAEIVGRPMEIHLNLYSTDTGKRLIELDWENGWGGQAGSMADRSRKNNFTESAEAVSSRLISELRKQ
jgi:hypothetical protein